MYENTGTDDKMTEAEDDIFTETARILQKKKAFLALFARWKRIPPPQNVETLK